MQTDRLFINGSEIDLSPGTVIALTFQINDVSDLQNRQAGYSNQFKVPKTKNNKSILGSPELIQSTTNNPYLQLPCKVLKKGLEVIPKGYAIVESTDTNFNITVYSGNYDFVAALNWLVLTNGKLGDKKLSDLDLSAYNHVFQMASIWGSNNQTYLDGWKYPIIDYGALVNTNRNIDPANLRPAMFIYTLVKEIIIQAGFNFSGAIFSDPNFRKLMLACSTLGGAKYFTILMNGISPFNLIRTWQPYTAAQIPITSGVWTYTLKVNYQITAWGGGTVFQVIQQVSGFSTVIHTHAGTTGFFTFTQAGSVTGAANLDFHLYINGTATGFIYAELTLTNPSSVTQIFAGIPIYQFNQNGLITDTSFGYTLNLVYGVTTFDMASSMPDMTQKDFMKGVINLFCLTFKTDSFTKTLTFAEFKEIAAAMPYAKDWSDKLHIDRTQEDNEGLLEYHNTNYAQINYLQYKNDTNDKEMLALDPSTSLGFYDGYFLIADQSLAPSKVVVALPFAATVMEKMLENLDIPLIRKIDNGVFKTSTEPRILVDDTQNITGAPITYIDIFNNILTLSSNVPLCYFSLLGKPFNLDWNTLSATFYTALINSLTSYKRITPQIDIKEIDINELDHFIPVFISKYNAYFYINKIINYTGKGLTKGELIRL